MTRGEDFIKKGKYENKKCSSMSNIAWCDRNKNKILRLHDYCPNPNCKCQKQITFSPQQFQLDGAGFRNTMKKYLKDLKQLGINSSNPPLTHQHRLLV